MANREAGQDFERYTRTLLATALESCERYYRDANGVHLDRSWSENRGGCEHLVQVRLYDEIIRSFNNSGQKLFYATLETRIDDIVRRSGLDARDFFSSKENGLRPQHRLDIVFYQNSSPKGIVEVKIGPSTEDFRDDLRRGLELSRAINAKRPRTMEIVAALFVKCFPPEAKIELNEVLEGHKEFFRNHAPDIHENIRWESRNSFYTDLRFPEKRHETLACIGWIVIPD